MMNTALSLDVAIRRVCPSILGVSLGDPGDRSTWRVDFPPHATDQERAAVAAVMAAFDPDAPLPRSATGAQLGDALKSMGKLSAWDAAVAASTNSQDQRYWNGGYRDLMPETSPKLLRIAKAAGMTLSAVFDAAMEDG